MLKKFVPLALPFSLFVLAGAIQAAEGLGCRPPNADEKAWMDANLIIPDVVIPNSTAITRLNAERQRAGLPPVTLMPAPEQDDVVGRTAQMRRAQAPEMIVRSAPPALPAAVDNSLLDAFPPVGNQGGLGTCACFSTTYYTMTYMSARARGVNVITGGDATIFSPKFCYNLINGGQDSGSWITTAFAVQQNHGVPTLAAWPYDGNFREWPRTADIWRNAIPSRMGTSGAVYSLDTVAGLQTLKQMIANGYILNFATDIWGWQTTTLVNDPGTSNDDPFVGNTVCHWHSNSGGPHAMTVVGYNDHLWVDLNGNGSVDAGEKGALRIINNWGNGWGNDGMMWLMYDALKSVTGVAGGITDANRDSAWWGNAAYWISARPAHQPTVIGEFTLNTSSRSVMGVSVGVSPVTQTSPSALQSSSFSGAGGLYAFDGTTSSCDGTFAFDLTDKVLAGSARYYLQATNNYPSGHPCEVKSFRLTDASGNTLSGAITTNPSGGLPLNADSTPVLAWTDLATVDVLAPAMISDLSTTLVTPTEITMTWTSTGDDGLSGTATAYDLRYSTNPITTSNWGGANQVTGEPLPKPPGNTESFQIIGLSPNTTYYVAIVALDDAGNASVLSPVISETTPGSLIITSPSILPHGTVGVSYASTLAASGGTGARSWSISTGHFQRDAEISTIPAVGTAKGWNADTGSWNYTFPSGFSFPFAGSSHSGLRISSDGYVEFGNTVTEKSGSDFLIKNAKVIAVCWRDLTTAGTAQAGEDIYIHEDSDSVTIRWIAETAASGSVSGGQNAANLVDTQITLFRDGTIACEWRKVPDFYNGYCGVSDGDGIHWESSFHSSYRYFANDTRQLWDYLSWPSGLTINSLNGLISGTPTSSGISKFGVTVEDSGYPAQKASVTRVLQVGSTHNDAPVVAATIANQTGTVGTAFTFTISAGTFTDSDGDTLTWSASNLPAGLTFDAGTRVISGTPTTVSAPVVTVSVDDGQGHTTSTTFSITVNPPVNVAPVVAASIANQTGTVGTQFNYTLSLGTFIDADGDVLTWSINNLPAGLTFNTSTRIISGNPTTAGVSVLTVTVNDGNGHSSSTQFSITIDAPANVPPNVDAGVDVVISLENDAALAAIVHDDGLPITSSLSILWSKIQGPGTVTWSQSTTASPTAHFSDVGLYTLQIRVSDGEMTSSDTVDVHVVASTDSNSESKDGAAPKCGIGGGLTACLVSLSLLLIRREGRSSRVG